MHTRRPAVFGSIPSTLLGSGSMHGGHVLHQEASHLISRGLDDGRSWASTSYDLGLISRSEAELLESVLLKFQLYQLARVSSGQRSQHAFGTPIGTPNTRHVTNEGKIYEFTTCNARFQYHRATGGWLLRLYKTPCRSELLQRRANHINGLSLRLLSCLSPVKPQLFLLALCIARAGSSPAIS